MLVVSELCVGTAVVLVCLHAQARRRRARACARLLARSAVLLGVEPAELAACLGTQGATIRTWMLDGVPRVAQRDVWRLARRATALCRQMPGSQALRLLELQRRAAAASAGPLRQSLGLARPVRRTIAGVVVTSR
jgi:hypothetical protein